MFQILLLTKGYLSSSGKNKEPQRNFEMMSVLDDFDFLNKGNNLLRVVWARQFSTMACRCVTESPHTIKISSSALHLKLPNNFVSGVHLHSIFKAIGLYSYLRSLLAIRFYDFIMCLLTHY